MQGAKVKVMDQLDSDVHPELETVDSAGRVPSASSLSSETYATSLDDDAANAVMAEAEFLSALIWAPPAISRNVLHAILGTPDRRQTTADTVLLDPAALFLHPTHRAIFAAIAAMADEDQPITAALVLARLDAATVSRRHRQLTRTVLVDLTSPATYTHPHHGIVLPALATTLIDAWYRRGYIRFIATMQQAITELPTHELAAHRDDMVAMSRAAETRMLAITDRLARI